LGSYTLVVAPMGVKFGEDEGPLVPSSMPNFTPIECLPVTNKQQSVYSTQQHSIISKLHTMQAPRSSRFALVWVDRSGGPLDLWPTRSFALNPPLPLTPHAYRPLSAPPAPTHWSFLVNTQMSIYITSHDAHYYFLREGAKYCYIRV